MSATTEHGTITGSVVTTVSFTTQATTSRMVEILNRGDVDLFARFDGDDPTEGGATGDHVVPTRTTHRVKVTSDADGQLEVKLIAADDCAFSLELL